MFFDSSGMLNDNSSELDDNAGMLNENSSLGDVVNSPLWLKMN